MSIIQIKNLSFSYNGGLDYIFKDVTLQLDTDWKLGLIGRNGRGKTTFLRLLQGRLDYSGSISSAAGFDYFPFEVENKARKTHEIIADIVPDYEPWMLERELNLLQVLPESLNKPFGILSGGEQMKLMLAALFLKENAFLLIDEPTNHLDLDARRAVGKYLGKKKSFILVSHDRALLDESVDHILSINRAGIDVQKGNFSTWQKNKEMQDSFELAENEKLAADIDRLKAASRRKAGWSDVAEKEKIGSGGCDRGYIGHKAAKVMKSSKVLERRQNKAVEEKTKLLKNVETADKLQISPLTHWSKLLIEARDLAVYYAGKPVFSNLSFDIKNGDRISLRGKNGSGKTSLLKLLTGQSIEYSGKLEIASGLKISYVPQDTSFLSGSLKEFALQREIDESLFKAILAKLDFSRTQFETDMSELSSGQKKKVLLASSLSEKAHLYIWDEPLNFVDIMSRIQIENAIKECLPTMLFIEHDADFVANIATEVKLLESGGKT